MDDLGIGGTQNKMDDLDLGSGSDIISQNVTCPISLHQRIQLKSLEFILPTVALGVLNIVVIIGNSLVILAVFTSAKLRTTTNTFVWSLAVADLLVGMLVLPFSIANEVMRFWVFGPIWCSVWLAVDVWLCTASILNLVAISFDRYVAISRPFKYHSLLSPKRGKMLVGGVWILSFVICFPPLIGWNEQGKGLGNRFSDGLGPDGSMVQTDSILSNWTEDFTSDIYSGSGNGNINSQETLGFDASAESLYILSSNIVSHFNFTRASTKTDLPKNLSAQDSAPTQTCESKVYPECGLTSDPGYIVYSALGSFWIPAIIMCVFYWKIYRTAVRSTAALKHGMLTTKAPGNDFSTTSDSVTLRIHRGGGGGSVGGVRTSVISDNGRNRSIGNSHSKCQYHRSFARESTSSSTNTMSDPSVMFINNHSIECGGKKKKRNKKYKDPSLLKLGKIKQKDPCLSRSSGPQPDFPLLGKNPENNGERYYGPTVFTDKKRQSKIKHSPSPHECTEISGTNRNDFNGIGENHHLHDNIQQQEAKSIAILRKSRRKNIKLELQKLNKEKKAAKTVGIIVGCFILCWLPFFTVYLVGAFCENCTPPLLFSIFFWLGYCNSAINPCVYALFSRDFRFAFKKLLRCHCYIEPRQKHQQMGFVTKLHSFKTRQSSRSNDSNSD